MLLRRTILLSLLTSACNLFFACGGAEVEPHLDGDHDLGTGGVQESELEPPQGLRPIHAAAFDHPPTQEEIDREFQGFLRSQRAAASTSFSLNPTVPQGLAPGYKLVTIIAYTSYLSNAGTDEADHVYFRGFWTTDTGQNYSESFILNNPGVDDLDRGDIDVFYYVMNVRHYVAGATRDLFISGKIGNTDTDGWHCQRLVVTDENHFGVPRQQTLAFNQWVDYPSPMESPWMAGSNSSWLSYY